jgi:formate C-acetyltransferase
MNVVIQKRKALFLQRRAEKPKAVPSEFYLNAYYKNIDKPPILREACALHAFYSGAALLVHPEERIVGIINADESAGFHYAGGTWVKESGKGETATDDVDDNGNETTNDANETADENVNIAAVHAKLFSGWKLFTDDEWASINAHASTTTWFAGHGVLDYERILEIGLIGYKDLLNHSPGYADFYESLQILLDGIIIFIKRLAERANPETAAALTRITQHPPETFHQALQLVWILHYLDNNDSFGRFDYYLRSFYEKETDKDNALDLLTDYWCKIEAVEEIQNMTIGGEYSELTRLCLDVTKELGFKGPNLCLRVTPDMPQDIWSSALDCIGTGLGLPALYNDGMYTKALIRSGVAPDVAKNYCFAGCSQIMIPGQCNFANDIGMLNAGKIFELTLYNGYDPRKEIQAGPETGADFTSYDDFYKAFIKQLEYGCKLQVSIHNKDLVERGKADGYALRSLFTRGCLESGLGFFEGGANYNHVELEIIGITNAADSLYALKKAVFDDKKLSFKELTEILKNNWDNANEWQNYFRNLPKFGNGYDEVDDIRTDITTFLYRWFNDAPGPFGGFYVPGEVIFTAHDHCGAATGATPDGRNAGEVLADSAGASMGASREGPTALMNSVLKLPVADYLLTSVALNMRFLPDTFNNPRTRKGIQTLLNGFFAQGGMQLQINVCNSEQLKAAQQSPEKYPDLIVRVGGYSDYFVRLSKTLQDEIIKRVEYNT